MNFVLVAIGGFLGSISRFYIYTKAKESFTGTWIANISGSLLFAISYKFFANDLLSEELWIFLTIGFSGSYTTFSTFGNETLQFILQKKYYKAIGYVISTLVISLLLIIIIFHQF